MPPDTPPPLKALEQRGGVLFDGCLDPCRPDPRHGHAVLPDLFPVPDPDGLGADPGRHALSAPPSPRQQDRGQARTGRHPAGRRWRRADRRADGDADEFAWRFGASTGQRRAEQLAEDSSPASRGRGMAGRRQAGPRRVVEGPCGPAGAGAEHAAKDRRTGENSPGLRRQHRGWIVAVHGVLHHCRLHHGLRAVGQSRSRAIFERIVGNARGSELPACPRRPFVPSPRG